MKTLRFPAATSFVLALVAACGAESSSCQGPFHFKVRGASPGSEVILRAKDGGEQVAQANGRGVVTFAISRSALMSNALLSVELDGERKSLTGIDNPAEVLRGRPGACIGTAQRPYTRTYR